MTSSLPNGQTDEGKAGALSAAQTRAASPSGLSPCGSSQSGIANAIRWHPNPLRTSIVLDDEGKALFRQRLRIVAEEELEGDNPTEAQILAVAGHFFSWAVPSLETESHCGDCTCVPMSCSKCIAEEWLGINTIKGCGKHQLYKIRDAFSEDGEEHQDIEKAIAALENYEPKADWDGWEEHLPRWKAEAEKALNWLIIYRDTHFPAQGMAAPSGGETGTGSTEGNSPVAEGHAPNPDSNPHSKDSDHA